MLKSSKLQNYLEKNHCGLKSKEVEYFDKTKAFFEVSRMIAKQKKAHNIGETLVKQSALAMVRIVLGKESERNIKAIPLPNNTVQKRIAVMANNIKEQVVTKVKEKSLFGLHTLLFDESTGISSAFQLIVFV